MAKNEKMSAVLDLKGLDLVTPVDLLKDGRTPFAKNFRLYAQQTDDRRVAVSSRRGPGFYVTPLAETLSDSNTAVLSASTANVGIVTGIHAQPFTAPSNDRITRIDINVADLVGASGPLMVQLYSDNGSGVIKDLLAESSILGGDISGTAAYVTARFLKAVKMTSGLTYWIVVRMQDDGTDNYAISTTTSGTKAWKSDSTLPQIVQQTYAINYKIYTAVDGTDKGAYRFNRENGENITVVVYGTTLYKINETTHELEVVLTGLDADAEEYAFTNGDGKVLWVNGQDQLTSWTGVMEADAANLVTNGTFETNTIGWLATGGGAGNVISRNTSQFHSGVASMYVAATAGANIHSARYTLPLTNNHRYKISYWVKGVTGATDSTVYAVGPNTTIKTTALTTGWQQVSFYYTATVSTITALDIRSSNENFYVDDVVIIDTGLETILDDQLPILSDVLMHKDRLFGIDAGNSNKLIWSEAPGNPSDQPSSNQWYYNWLSTSFFYIPRPYNGSPITGMLSFQDSLTVFTQDKKYIFSGYDKGSFNLREATGVKGALSKRGIASDENNIYFVSHDGLYMYNGSSDVKLSSLINPLFDACGQKENITSVIWKNEVRFYLASLGSPVNDSCIIYNKDLKELMYDTETYVNRAIFYGDADDNQELVEFSSLAPVAYLAEQNFHSAGAPIDFEYRLKYDSMGTPAQRKRLKRFYPLLQGVDSSFPIQLAMDKDFQDSPRIKDVLMTVKGALWGEFNWGDGTLWGGDKSFKMHRQSYSGYANYWQLRVMRKGVNNRVAFIGAQFSYKTKRL